tara:strand:- start:2017 stop:3609 length:1593 start_codon:yes stop_codon:yes gene_type:complete
MKCKISCSFGEVIDKITILKIKKNKATSKECLKNINNELNTIQNEISYSKKKDILFNDLYNVNKKLWELEDLIREKSSMCEYDKQFIECAKNIHIMNDKRYEIKKEINNKYKSNIKEEKIYNIKNDLKNNDDIKNLENCKNCFNNGNYIFGKNIIDKLRNKYKNYQLYDKLFVEIFFTGSIYDSFNGVEDKYINITNSIIKDIDNLNIQEELKKYCKLSYSYICLEKNDYKNCYLYLNYINSIQGPNINSDTMSFFNKNDKNKLLLVYDGGGIGDKIMFSRFLIPLSEKYIDNNIVFIVNDNLCWMFKLIFKDCKNINIVGYKFKHLINNFNYHCNLISLIYYLSYEYNNIFFKPLLENMSISITDSCKNIINNIKKNTYIINWKGSSENTHEKNNRSISLYELIPLFKLDNINWIVITKNITKEEFKILNKYKINCYGDSIDNEKSFYDSISIMKNVKGVITTDTSIAHISLNLNITTYVLLTKYCEWRWKSNNNKTTWYPNAILIRQNKQNNWNNVIDNLSNIIVKSN